VHDDVTGRWRRAGDRLVREFEPRLENLAAFGSALPEAAVDAIAAAGLVAADIKHAAFAGPDPRAPMTAVTGAGLARETLVKPLISELGDAGAAAPGLALARTLETAAAGDHVLVGGAGDGAEAAVLTRGPATIGEPLTAALRERRELPSYVAYLAARDLLVSETGEGDVDVSPVAYHRRRRSILARYGGRCGECGVVQFPPADSCVACSARGTLESHRLSDRGTLYTYTVDHLIAGGYDERGVPRCVIDLDGGGRFYASMTEWDPDQLAVGMPVELAFRVRGRGGGFINYGWKCRPAVAAR
ncbi:MAG: Zn-ribbon domain-containing OB-fold protein, partial [Solirubrobacterales bacterium]